VKKIVGKKKLTTHNLGKPTGECIDGGGEFEKKPARKIKKGTHIGFGWDGCRIKLPMRVSSKKDTLSHTLGGGGGQWRAGGLPTERETNMMGGILKHGKPGIGRKNKKGKGAQRPEPQIGKWLGKSTARSIILSIQSGDSWDDDQ